MRFFISCVSSEFRDCRNRLARDLRRFRCDVLTQEDFLQEQRPILSQIESYIDTCDRVLVIVGEEFGQAPEDVEPRRSYAQWEFHFALGERLDGRRAEAKAVRFYTPSETFYGNSPRAPRTAEDVARQRAFRAEVEATHLLRVGFDSAADLSSEVLIHNFGTDTWLSDRSPTPLDTLLRDFVQGQVDGPQVLALPALPPVKTPVVESLLAIYVDLSISCVQRRAVRVTPPAAPSPIAPQAAPPSAAASAYTLPFPNDASAREQQQRDRADNQNWNVSEAFERAARCFVYGEPGCGKSTLLTWMAHRAGKAWLARESRPWAAGDEPRAAEWLPILFRSGDFADVGRETHISDMLETLVHRRQFAKEDVKRLTKHLENLAGQGRVLLLFDGLNEVSPDVRGHLLDLLDRVSTRFRDAAIVLTSRASGFEDVQRALARTFDLLRVEPLSQTSKRDFIERWANLNGLPEDQAATLATRLCDPEQGGGKTDTIMTLAIASQLQMVARRGSLLRSMTEVMVERAVQARHLGLRTSAVLACLEDLGYRMQADRLRQLTDTQVVKLFAEFKSRSTNTLDLAMVEPANLLEACTQSTGPLNVAMIVKDRRGQPQGLIEFLHDSFQEYFAAQAILHGWAAGANEDFVSRLHVALGEQELRSSKIVLFGRHHSEEQVLVGRWRESIRMVIAELAGREADDALQLLLPAPDTPSAESRARAAFALLCLAEEPAVSAQTVTRLTDLAAASLTDADGFNRGVNTSMDEAVRAVARSSWAPVVREQFLASFMREGGVRRKRLGSVLLSMLDGDTGRIAEGNAAAFVREARAGLSSTTPSRAILTALGLVNAFYLADGKLGFLTPAQQSSLVDALVKMLPREGASQYAAMWALMWLTRATHHYRGPVPAGDLVFLDDAAQEAVRAVLASPAMDGSLAARACGVLTRGRGLRLVCEQEDWLRALAAIADGDLLRRRLAPVAPSGCDASTSALLLDHLGRGYADADTSRIALSLGSLGVTVQAMIDPLARVLFSDAYSNQDRDEAMLYLALEGGPEVAAAFRRAHATTPVDGDDYLFTRGLFGLLLTEDLDSIAGEIERAQDHYDDLSALALTLARSEDPRGPALLFELKPPSDAAKLVCNRALLLAATEEKEETTGVEGGKGVRTRDKVTLVLLVRGTDLEQKPIFAYVGILSDKLEAFMTAQAQGVLYPENYGVIIESGAGTPNAEVRARMETEWGFDHDGMVDVPNADAASEVLESYKESRKKTEK